MEAVHTTNAISTAVIVELRMFFVRFTSYYLTSNELVEPAVQIVEKRLKKIVQDNSHTRLAQFLSTYHLTPQTLTGVTPGELLLRRCPCHRSNFHMPHTAKKW